MSIQRASHRDAVKAAGRDERLRAVEEAIRREPFGRIVIDVHGGRIVQIREERTRRFQEGE